AMDLRPSVFAVAALAALSLATYRAVAKASYGFPGPIPPGCVPGMEINVHREAGVLAAYGHSTIQIPIHRSTIWDMRQAVSDPGFSQSLERGLSILSAFTPDCPALGISELARRLSLTRSTTHRYVATLATLGYLQQDESTRKYRLGSRVLDLGFSMLGSLDLREIAAPYLRRLTDSTGHTSNLAIRDDTDVILIDRVRGRPGRCHHLEFTLHIGSRLPSYCSATGKALLAWLPRRDLGRLLDRMDLIQRGPRTVTDKAALIA